MLKGSWLLSGRAEIHHWTLEARQAFAGKKCLDRGDASGRGHLLHASGAACDGDAALICCTSGIERRWFYTVGSDSAEFGSESDGADGM